METFSLKRGLKKFGQKGEQAAYGEMLQLHQRECFDPIHPNKLTPREKKKVLESLIFLIEKRDGRVKARTCANGSVQRQWMHKDDAASPTAAIESILLTAVIDAFEDRAVATVDIPNAFIQTNVGNDKDNDRIVMKVRGPLVDYLLRINYQKYHDKVVYENNVKVLYLHVRKAIYGMLQSALLFYQKLRNDLEEQGFKISPYDPCVATKHIDGYQMTLVWHVDDLKVSHKKEKAIDQFLKWLESKYGNEEINKMKAKRGKKHDYLGMILDYTEKGKVKIDMTDYVKAMIREFPEELKGRTTTPASERIFEVNESSKLNDEQREIFHTFVAKALFVAKRSRPDIQVPVAFLCTRVREPTEEDWLKLTRMMKFLKDTKDDCLILGADSLNIVKWYADASFAVHPDMKSHTGFNMTLGQGSIISSSRKQKMNSRSSTEAEIIACDDSLTQVLWTRLFLESIGYKTKTIMKQDNTSSIQLEMNGKASSHKRTRHIDIRFFFITDQIEKGIIQVEYCPTMDMEADYLSKPTQGELFRKQRNRIMGLSSE
jgi:hypothetical protein